MYSTCYSSIFFQVVGRGERKRRGVGRGEEGRERRGVGRRLVFIFLTLSRYGSRLRFETPC